MSSCHVEFPATHGENPSPRPNRLSPRHPRPFRHPRLVALAATLLRTVSMRRSLYAASARSIVAFIARSSDGGTSYESASPLGIDAGISDADADDG